MGAGRGPMARAVCTWFGCSSGCRSRSTPLRGEARRVSPEISAGAFVSSGARLADDVDVGPGAVVNEGVALGAGCIVESGAVLGKRPRLRTGSSAAGYELGPLVIEEDVTVCC